MFIHLLIWTFKFCLLIPKAYSFRTPKHDPLFYYKSRDSVFLTNPTNHTTSYGIYVAGQTIRVDIPTSVVNVSDILDWKVVNLNKDQLMFVHQNKPYILINREIIREMEYSGELSDSIIAFGDNEALHVPTIFNPNLTEPVPKGNYIELLYFDDQSEKVSVRRSLPWLEDDWKFIIEWKMTDYIHFDDKLYLLIKRSISKANSQGVTQEISIIRLCLDKGSELISSAVEIHFTREAFESSKIIDLVFVFVFKPFYDETNRYQLHTTELQYSSNTKFYYVYYIGHFVSLFEQAANDCAFGCENITLLRHHLRSEVGKCKKTFYKSCSTKENIVPSRVGSLVVIEEVSIILDTIYNSHVTVPHKIQFVTLPYPYDTARLLMHVKPFLLTYICKYHDLYVESPRCMIINLNTISSDDILEFGETDFHVNKRPHGSLFVTKETNKILFIPIEMCSNLKTCTQCIMYGLYFDCIWSNSMCTRDDQPKNKTALTVDHCFKIINISPLIFNSSSPTILTIQLDKPLIPDSNSREYIVIKAGPHNHCINITRNGPFFNCTLNLLEPGKFKVDVSLRNDEYADVSTISAASIDEVHIFAPERDPDYTFTVIFILFLGLLISSFSLIAYTKFNKEYVTKFKKFSRTRKVKGFVGAQSAITRFRSKILSSTMNTLTGSTVTNEPASKHVSRWSSM